MRWSRQRLDELEIEDELSFRHVGLYPDLKQVVSRSGLRFLVPSEGSVAWDRAVLLNLLFWEPGTSDVLTAPRISADVVMHVAWHHLGDANLEPSVEGHLLAESVASAFDLYLVGRLLGHAPESDFLTSQVPRMAEIAEQDGLESDDFEALLEEVSAEPERAFEEVRQLLFDASLALLPTMSPEAASEVLGRFDGQRFAPLLHHFELPTWVLRARLEATRPQVAPAASTGRASAADIDAALRAAPDSLAWLEERWLRPLMERPQG